MTVEVAREIVSDAETFAESARSAMTAEPMSGQPEIPEISPPKEIDETAPDSVQLCQLGWRLWYLIRWLRCSIDDDPGTCEEDAEDTYCTEHDSCAAA